LANLPEAAAALLALGGAAAAPAPAPPPPLVFQPAVVPHHGALGAAAFQPAGIIAAVAELNAAVAAPAGTAVLDNATAQRVQAQQQAMLLPLTPAMGALAAALRIAHPHLARPYAPVPLGAAASHGVAHVDAADAAARIVGSGGLVVTPTGVFCFSQEAGGLLIYEQVSAAARRARRSWRTRRCVR
jgi:hypothetical protein